MFHFSSNCYIFKIETNSIDLSKLSSFILMTKNKAAQNLYHVNRLLNQFKLFKNAHPTLLPNEKNCNITSSGNFHHYHNIYASNFLKRVGFSFISKNNIKGNENIIEADGT